MSKGRNFIGLVLVVLALLPLSALLSSSYTTFRPILYHVSEPKVGEHHLNSTSPSFSYYIYNFMLSGHKLEIENLVTNAYAAFEVPSGNVTVFTVSNTSIVYVYSGGTLLEVVLSRDNISSHEEFKLSERSAPWYVHGYILASSQLYATWINATTIEAENGSDEYLIFTPNGRLVEFRANVTSFYESGQLWLFDFANGSALLVSVNKVTFRGLLEFPYSFRGQMIFYNVTSGYLEEYTPAQGGQSLLTVQQLPSKIVKVEGVQEVLYLGDLAVVSVGGREPLTLIYNLSSRSPVKSVAGQVTEVVYNASDTYVLFGAHNTTVLNRQFNVVTTIYNSETYCVNGIIVVEYSAPSGDGEAYIPATNHFFPLQDVNVDEQPMLLERGLLAFPEDKGEGGLTWLWVVNLTGPGSFQALAYYSNATYEFEGTYYFYNGTIYNLTRGTLVYIATSNSSGYIQISGGTINVTIRAGNVSLILPNGNYVLTYQGITKSLDLDGTTVYINLSVPRKVIPTSTTTNTSTTITPQLESSPPPVGVSPPGGQTGPAAGVNSVEIVLIVLGYVSIISIYLYRRRK